MRLSPDGKHIAAIQSVDGRPQVIIYDFSAAAGVKTYAFTIGDAVAEQIFWVNNDRLISIYGENTKRLGDEKLRTWMRAISMNAQAKDVVWLNKAPPFFDRVTIDDPGHIYVQWHQPYLDKTSVFRVDVATGDIETSEKGIVGTVGFILDGHAHAAARLDRHGKELQYDLSLPSGGEWSVAATFDILGDAAASLEGVTVDGNAIGVRRAGAQGTEILDRFEISSRKFGDPLFSDPQYDLAGVPKDDWTGQIVGVRYIDDSMRFRYFDPVRADIQRKLEKALPDQTVEITSNSSSGDEYIVRTEGVRQPPTFHLLHARSSQLETLLPAYPGLTSADLGAMKPYPYKSRDGLDIHAYLTLPPGKTPSNLPTVIFPHGGPGARDQLAFDWWAQFMTSRGYAVLQPNFRGSTGYGVTFRDAGNGQWGRKMQDDITDGVQKLVADGIADPKRICIVGASYGGYAALAGVTFTPGLYACAISVAGVSDLPSIIGFDMKRSDDNRVVDAQLNTLIGDRWSGEEHLKEVSPAFHAKDVKVPVLLIHCANDLTVPIVQSEEEQTALQKAGKNVQFIAIDGDDHYLELSKTRIQMLKAVEAFLAANIGT